MGSAVGAEAGAGAGEVGGVPRWVIGLAIGVPVAAALGYIIFGPSGDKKKKTKKGDTKSSPAKTKPVPSPSVEKKVEEVTDG